MGIFDSYKHIKMTDTVPYMTVTKKMISFSKQAIDDLGGAPYVNMFLNEKTKHFGIQACKKSPDAVPFVRPRAEGMQVLARWHNASLIRTFEELTGCDFDDGPVRISGRFYPEENAIDFDLKSAAPSGASKK